MAIWCLLSHCFQIVFYDILFYLSSGFTCILTKRLCALKPLLSTGPTEESCLQIHFPMIETRDRSTPLPWCKFLHVNIHIFREGSYLRSMVIKARSDKSTSYTIITARRLRADDLRAYFVEHFEILARVFDTSPTSVPKPLYRAEKRSRLLYGRIIGPIANLKGPYFQPSLSVCLSLTGTSTLQRKPILTKLGHKDPTLI